MLKKLRRLQKKRQRSKNQKKFNQAKLKLQLLLSLYLKVLKARKDKRLKQSSLRIQ